MSANTGFQHVNEWSGLRGFTNLFRKENRAWWSTRRWWINALLWPLILGGLVANMMFVPSLINLASSEEIAEAGGVIAYAIMMGLSGFFEFGTQLVALGAVVLCQDALIDEKQSGITEWLLSKPVTRRAYILAKLLTHMAYTTLFLTVIPATVAYGLFSLRTGEPFPLLPFLAGAGMMGLNILFYVSLTIMLGTWFNSRAPIVAVTLGLLFGGSFIGGLIKPLLYVTPWLLPQLASGIASQLPLPINMVWPPVVATVVWILIFIAVTLVKFEKTEF